MLHYSNYATNTKFILVLSAFILWQENISAKKNYLYLTYNASEDDLSLTSRPAIITLGSGLLPVLVAPKGSD